MKKVSFSKASCYLGCPYQHFLKYIKRLRQKKPVRPLTFGKDFHTLLQFRHDKEQRTDAIKQIKKTYNDLPPLFQSELGDTYLDDLKTIFSDYRKVWKGTEKPIETEHEFLIHISNYKGEPVYFHGVIDEEYDGLVLGEHKTFKTMPSMGTLAMNMQTCLYAKARELEKGQKFVRVQWDYIRSSPSQYPIWLEKSQRLSEAKSQNITPFSWLRACDEKGINDENIRAKSTLYEPNISNFFFRCNAELLPVMVDNVWEDFKYLIRDLITRESTNRVKNIGRQCNWCDYRPICYAEFTGADINYIIETDYIIKEDNENEGKIIESAD